MELNIKGNLVILASTIEDLGASDLTINVDGDALIVDSLTELGEDDSDEEVDAYTAVSSTAEMMRPQAEEPWRRFNVLPVRNQEIEIREIGGGPVHVDVVTELDPRDKSLPVRIQNGLNGRHWLRGPEHLWRPYSHPMSGGTWNVNASGSLTFDAPQADGRCGYPREDGLLRIDWSADLTGENLGQHRYVMDTEEIRRYFNRLDRPRVSAEELARKAARDLFDMAARKGATLKKATVQINGVDNGGVTYTWPEIA